MTTTTEPQPPILISQGAEALLYLSPYLTPQTASITKYRPPKPYRHPTLDARLTKHRVLLESRLLIRVNGIKGVRAPRVYYVDPAGGKIVMEYIDGCSVRDVLIGVLKAHGGAMPEGEQLSTEVKGLMAKIGRMLGAMHKNEVVHGDLTTSNIMLRDTSKDKGGGELVVIDFGLGSVSTQEEDKAVDLYVLERAFISTHPKAEGLFDEVLKAYAETSKGARIVLKRLDEVRLRGRKKSMVG
ncbi:kinase-like protein [Ascobolus immersus RN42]|uniref:EKC/KEOPS complex subunit BUD32 n=1 Tax=Ascobolus immersus RN42 TaxID=1160509 RepID=A0A3N4IRF3_ASCIM|nr:kinase-like protein [Ascobolus immersus RN42]